MTLDDLEHQNRGFCGFCPAKHISRANWAEFTTDRPRQAACSIANIDFNSTSLDLLGLRKPAHEGIKDRPLKVFIWLLLGSLPWKRLQIGRDMLPITTSPSDEPFSRINIVDFERPWTPKIRGFIVFLQSLTEPRTSRVNCGEMATIRQFVNGNC